MKKVVILLFFVSLSILGFAQGVAGLTCETAIPVNNNYQGSIAAPGEYYYSVWTFDLPLTCYFYPTTEDVSTLYLDVDFTCIPGVYEDSNIAELIQDVAAWGEEMPLRFDDFNKGVDDNNRVYYSLSVSEVYRELMTGFGISYDVQALVKLTTSSAGEIYMTPDTAFRSCVESSIRLDIPKSISLGAIASDDVYLLPLGDWQEDGLTVTWEGVQSPVQIWIGKDCGFELKTFGENCALTSYELYPDAGNGENILDLTKNMIGDLMDLVNQGGICYVRFVSLETANIVWEKRKLTGPLAQATKLELNQAAAVKANDSEQLYYFPKKWQSDDIKFTTPSHKSIKAYFAKDYNFSLDAYDANVIGVYDFVSVDGQLQLGLSSTELKTLASTVADDYVLVKFVSEENTSITPSKWVVSDCVNKSTEIYTTDSVLVERRASGAVYRFNYRNWSKYNFNIKWNSRSRVDFYIADFCDGYTLSETNEHVLFYKRLQANEELTLTSEQIKAWESRVDDEGYLYIRMNANAAGGLQVSSILVDAPEPEPEPVQTLFPLVFDESINLEADNVDNTYYITRDWANLNIEFVTNSPDSVYAYFATAAEFDLDSQDPNFLAVYPFYRENGQSSLQLSAKQLNGLLDATSDTLFVVFHAFYNTQLTTYKWNACACVENSLELRPNDQHALIAYATNTVFRVKYSQWQDRDVTLLWNSNINLKAYLADTCDFKLTYSNKHVLNKKNYEIAANSSISIGKDVRTEAIDKGKLPDNGFLYFRFVSTEAGLLTTSFIQNGSGSTTDVDDVTLSPSYQLYIDADGRMYLYVDGKRYNILGQVVD